MNVLFKLYAILAITTAATIHTVNAEKYLADKPDFLMPCHLQDSNFNKCLGKNYEMLFSAWKDGVPGLKSIGSFDPIQVKHVVLNQDPKNPVALNADLSNLVVKGASKAEVHETSFNPKTLELKLKVFIPKLRFDSDYKVNGKILNLALNGHGKAFCEVENVILTYQLQLKLRDEYGFTFTDIDKLNLDISDIGGLHIHLDNLFNGEKVLEDSTNAVFNENWRDFYEILKPAVHKALQVVMVDRFSKIYSYVPANYFVADIPSAAEHKVTPIFIEDFISYIRTLRSFDLFNRVIEKIIELCIRVTLSQQHDYKHFTRSIVKCKGI